MNSGFVFAVWRCVLKWRVRARHATWRSLAERAEDPLQNTQPFLHAIVKVDIIGYTITVYTRTWALILFQWLIQRCLTSLLTIQVLWEIRFLVLDTPLHKSRSKIFFIRWHWESLQDHPGDFFFEDGLWCRISFLRVHKIEPTATYEPKEVEPTVLFRSLNL